MTTSKPWLFSVLALLAACDSNEIGATVGEDGTSGAFPAETEGADTSGGMSGGEIEFGPCAAASDAESCEELLGGDSLTECRWVEVHVTDAACDVDEIVESRCVTVNFQGDGCLPTPCNAAGEQIYVHERDDGGTERITSVDIDCSFAVQAFDTCLFGIPNFPLGPACECTCEGLGGIICEPRFGACTDGADGGPQECEPTPENDGWSCVPQTAGTSPAYGQACSPEDSPAVACEGDTICLPAAGLGIAGCDGTEAGGCCAQLCSVDLDDCPEVEQVCTPYYEGDAPAGYENLGVCRLP